MKEEMKCPYCGSTDDDVFVGATSLECKCEGLRPEFQERNIEYTLLEADAEGLEDWWFAVWHGIDLDGLLGKGPTKATAFSELMKATVKKVGPITNIAHTLAVLKERLTVGVDLETTLADGNYHHVATTYDKGTTKKYIDGRRVE